MPYEEKSAYAAQAKLKGKNPTKKKVGFGMRYQEDPSAFPFKSPYKQMANIAAGAVAGNVMGVTGQNTRRYQDWNMPPNHPSRRRPRINPNMVGVIPGF